ncbi:MAG TPA: MG2 domain-containing protein [Gemmatimonadaceae bacterium]
MRPAALALVLAGSLTTSFDPGPLRVLRATPSGEASPTASIAVTFDRPVAGSLDRTVPPESVLVVEPAIEGRLEWRDPVTVRLVPSRPLVAGRRYSVTVRDAFTAMDGSRLAEPYRFAVRVRSPMLLHVGAAGSARADLLGPRPRLEAVYSDAVPAGWMSRVSFLELAPRCAGERIVRLRAVEQRAITSDDGWRYVESGGWRRDRSADSLRRVVALEPERALPLDCVFTARLPRVVDTMGTPELRDTTMSTYGPLRLAAAACGGGDVCPTGPLRVTFSTPVSGAEVQRRLTILPETKFTVHDTVSTSTDWVLQARLAPRTGYAVVADTGMRDVFGQRLTGNPAAGVRTTGYAPSIDYPSGRLLVERKAFRTLAVRHVNVDTLVVEMAPVPDSLVGRFLARGEWGWRELWQLVQPGMRVRRIPLRAERDRPSYTGVPMPAASARTAGAPTLWAVRVRGSGRADASRGAPIALVHTSDLGVHAKIGAEDGAVWVTGASDGAPRAGAEVVLRDARGRALARAATDARGVARLTGIRPPRPDSSSAELGEYYEQSFSGFVTVTLGDDRAIIGVSSYDPDLGLWQFGVSPAWGDDRVPLAGGVFTERGIYRPGEEVHAKAIVRAGPLGALTVPPPSDSIRWTFADREGATLLDTVVAPSRFGTAARALPLSTAAPLGDYSVRIEAKRQGVWRHLGATGFRVAEYRPPEFLVDVSAPGEPRLPGDTLAASVQARYLFGAPMARAEVAWQVRRAPLSTWELEIPGTEGWYVGDEYSWWDDGEGEARRGPEVTASGVDTLDAGGNATLRVPLHAPASGLAARVTLTAAVTDVNRQVVAGAASVVVHPAAFYLAARSAGDWFWREGEERTIEVVAVGPDGRRVAGVAATATVVRREWHQVHRVRNGVAELVGEWVADTVARCRLTTAAAPVPCRVTPPGGGQYTVRVAAMDEAGREAATSFHRWAAGAGWVPWSDETRFKMDVVADRDRYTVGDTATVLFASPFTDAEAWITVEREGIIEQRRMRLTSGATTLKLPISERWAPNVYVSMVVARGRSAEPGPLDDPGRPTIRVGYTELRVTPEVKRLAVRVTPGAAEYRPGDTARVRLAVRDGAGRGHRAEVTLWAVDEGVLALTGYRTPDPIDLLYAPRGLGVRLASNLASVAPQVPEGEKGSRAPGGGGGSDALEILRSRFKTTAFFLGSVVTDDAGNAVAAAKLPDNLTTFRVMAVAVTAGDRYGSGEAPMLVTRPLVARPALPRFVRPGDEFLAGTVVNDRAGVAPEVTVAASATGVELRGDETQRVALEAGGGREVRFRFRALPGDSARLRFVARGGEEADAVETTIPIRPDHHPSAQTIAGVLRDSASVEFALPEGTDAGRSTVTLSLGSSPLAVVRGIERDLRVYPYYCTEQVASVARPLLALYRARLLLDTTFVRADAARDIARAVAMIERRQRPDGGIGFWSAEDWTTPWLSAYAGIVLLEARGVGLQVNDSVLVRLADFLTRELHGTSDVALVSPVALWRERAPHRLAEHVAAVDYLSRMGRADLAAEHELLRQAGLLRSEDRMRLAEVVARRGAIAEARTLLAPSWASVRVEGNRAVLVDTSGADFYFASSLRPTARLLSATLAVDSAHALVGPLVETLVQSGRQRGWYWNTQDRAALVDALTDFGWRQRQQGERTVAVRSGRRVVLEAASQGAVRETTRSLDGLVTRGDGGRPVVRLSLDARGARGATYYYVTVRDVPSGRQVTPQERGIAVERWYERYDGGTPIVSAVEGDLVRVRLRITVPAERRFVVLDDPLPAGLEAIDLSLRTAAPPGIGQGFDPARPERVRTEEGEGTESSGPRWAFGRWDSGWWSPFDHRELRDDRVVWAASVLWPGTYTATYLARATTPGTFVRPPAWAEEMYNPAVNGRSDGGVFTVTRKGR